MVESKAAFVSHIRDPQFQQVVRFISRETVDESPPHYLGLIPQQLWLSLCHTLFGKFAKKILAVESHQRPLW